MIEERRVHPRIPLRRKVGIIQSTMEIAYCWSDNASRGGMQVVADFDADIGQEFDTLINIPDSFADRFVWIKVRSQVVHVIFSGKLGAYRIGLKFVKFRDNARELYYECLAEHQRRYSLRGK